MASNKYYVCTANVIVDIDIHRRYLFKIKGLGNKVSIPSIIFIKDKVPQ